MSNITAEMFAVGKWNGYEFSVEDLNGIASAFTVLKDVHKVPLKFGHNDTQPMTDGQPALGWVDRVYVENNKLMGEFTDVPDIVRKAMEKKMYRKVSVELDIGVQHKGKEYAYVLSGVALLGADIPAVNTLADLSAYLGDSSLAAARMEKGTRLACTSRLAFSAVQGNVKEGLKMEKDEVQKMISDATKPLVEQLTKAQDEAKKFAAEKAQLEAELKKVNDADKTVKVKMAREQVTKIIEDGVKAGSITPAQREQFSKLLRVDNDDEVTKIDMEAVKVMVNGEKKMSYNKETGKDGSEDRIFEDAGEELDRLAKEEMDKVPTMKYSRALEVAMIRNKELASEYLGGVE